MYQTGTFATWQERIALQAIFLPLLSDNKNEYFPSFRRPIPMFTKRFLFNI